jgi:hypothetical protein
MENGEPSYFCLRCNREIDPKQSTVFVKVAIEEPGLSNSLYQNNEELLCSRICMSCVACLLTEAVIEEKAYLAVDIEKYNRNN